mgnify:CR=1 FL=1
MSLDRSSLDGSIVLVTGAAGGIGRAIAERFIDGRSSVGQPALSPDGARVAFVVATTATLGSLYLSEVVHLIPCTFCWYQRIAMYPIAAVALVGPLMISMAPAAPCRAACHARISSDTSCVTAPLSEIT